MKRTIFRNSQPLSSVKIFPSVFEKSKIPVPCSQHQIIDHHSEPQQHSSHRYNKIDLRHKNVTEGEAVKMTIVNNGNIKLI